MIAARPISAARAASPRQRITAGSRGDSENFGAASVPGHRRMTRCPAEGEEADERERERDDDREADDVRAAGGHTDGNGQDEHRQDVVDDRGADDRPSGP